MIFCNFLHILLAYYFNFLYQMLFNLNQNCLLKTNIPLPSKGHITFMCLMYISIVFEFFSKALL